MGDESTSAPSPGGAVRARRRSLGGRVARLALATLLVAVAVLALVIGGALTLMRTSWGTDHVLRFVLPRANAALSGRLAVDGFRFAGDRIALTGVRLTDPDGEAVVRVARVEVTFSPLALLRRRLDLRAVTIDAPQLSLRLTEGGSNLARALAPRTPSPPSPPSRPPDVGGAAPRDGFTVALGALAVRDGDIEVIDARDTTPAARAHIRLGGVHLDGGGELASDSGDFVIHLAGGGDATAPWRAPLSLKVDGHGRLAQAEQAPLGTRRDSGSAGDVAVEVAIGENTFHAAGQFDSTPVGSPNAAERSGAAAALRATGTAKVHVTPALVRWLVPDSPLASPVTVTGQATWAGEASRLSADVTLAAGGATAHVKATATADAARPAIDGLAIEARGIDLARLVVDGPPSALSFDLAAHGSGRDLDSLRGALTLKVPPGRMGGYALGPIRLRADADRGRYKVMDLLAVLPGANITGAGEATARTVAFRGVVDLRDLGATVRSLTAGQRAGARPRAAGHGRVDVSASGNLRSPALHVRGHLVGLAFGELRVPRLALSADVPDLHVPLASSVDVRIPEADIGARRFAGFGLSLRAAGPRFDARIVLAAPEKVALELGGAWRSRRTEIAFEKFSLAAGHSAWGLARPMRLQLGGGAVRVIGLDWRDGGDGQLRLDGERTPRALRVDAALSGFDLGKLPRAWLPAGLRPGGKLSGAVRFSGPSDAGHDRGHDRAKVEARVDLEAGQLGDLRDLSVHGEGELVDGRLSGRVSAGALGAKIAGSFALPLVWPPAGASPVTADVTISNVDLAALPAALRKLGGTTSTLAMPAATVRGTATATASATDATSSRPVSTKGEALVKRPPPGIAGIASAHLTVAGSGARPRLTARVEVRQLAVNGAPAPDLGLTVDATADEAVTARLEWLEAPGAHGPAMGGPSFVNVRTGFSLASLIRHAPSTETMLATPVHLEAAIAATKLAPLVALAGYPRSPEAHAPGGALSLKLLLDGPPRALRGHLGLSLDGVSSGAFPPTDAAVELELGPRQIRAQARVTRQGATLFSLTGHIDAPTERLVRARAALADIAIELHAVLGPFDLQRLGLPPQTDRQPARVLRGRMGARADVTGTLRAPRVVLHAAVTDLRLDETAIGNAEATVTSRDRHLSADVMLVSGNGGRLHLVASAPINLGYPAIVRGIDPRTVAVVGRIDAKGFDLSGLSGSTPGLRSVGGQLFAGLDVTGTAADPRVAGRLEWKGGELIVTGMGAYKQIHLLVHGANEHLVLDELRADSGGGRARITGSGDHRSGGGYAVEVAVDLHDFPAYVEGQALATLSLRASAESQVSVQRVRAKVSIDSARLALSDAKRKHLQSLSEPSDVVLVDGGTALNRAQAQKLAAVAKTLEDASAGGRAGGVRVGPARPAGRGATAGVIVIVNAPRNLWVNGMDANLELGLEPGFRVEVSDIARVFGQVSVKRGRVDVVGRRFDLKADSTVRFAGSPDAPELDVSANHVNDKENITVLVNVKGTPDHLQIQISAPDRPDLTETQLYTLIVTGRLDLGSAGAGASPTTTTDRAASLVGGLVAAQLQKGLAKKLPFDVLTIEAGDSLGAARLEAGTYVTSALYVGYVGRVGADPALLQNRNAVHLEYELGSRWSFQGEYGDAKTGSADMIWTKRY